MVAHVTLLLLTNNKTMSLYHIRSSLTSLYVLTSSKLTTALGAGSPGKGAETQRVPRDPPDTPASTAGQAGKQGQPARQSRLFCFKMKCLVKNELRLNLEIRRTMAFLLMLLNIFSI